MLLHRTDWYPVTKSTPDHLEHRQTRLSETNPFARCALKKFLILSCLLVATSASALADNFIYGNNASFGAPYVFQIDKTTGVVTDFYTNLSGLNGRGVVIVGTTMYYTDANDNHVYSYNLTTKTPIGTAFTVAGASALSTIAYDGTNFWIGDYSGTNKAYLYTPTGTLLKTITLANCTGSCDGLEYFVDGGGNARLIENRGDADGPYDLYDTNGNLLTADYINSTGATTGIAFDGTDFYTSNIFAGTLSEWTEAGTFVKTISLTGAGNTAGFLIEDLSFDYSQVLPPPSGVPEPSTFILVGSSMLGLAGAVRRRLARGQK
jgi:hypothetical protein